MKWRSDMRPPKQEAARALATVFAFLATLVIAGCATSYNYAYDPTTRFAELKSYAWATPQPHSLVETNVRFIADPLLEQKGFTQATDKPDIIIAIVYANELFSQGYELQTLTLRSTGSATRSCSGKGQRRVPSARTRPPKICGRPLRLPWRLSLRNKTDQAAATFALPRFSRTPSTDTTPSATSGRRSEASSRRNLRSAASSVFPAAEIQEGLP